MDKMDVMRDIARQLAVLGPKDTKVVVDMARKMASFNRKFDQLHRKLNQLEREISNMYELVHYIGDPDLIRKVDNRMSHFRQVL